MSTEMTRPVSLFRNLFVVQPFEMTIFRSLAFSVASIALTAKFVSPHHAEDRFNYGRSNFTEHDYGPRDWGLVNCSDIRTCPGWPTNWEDFHDFIPYNGTEQRCMDCSNSIDGICYEHQQSPIHLLRNVTASRECVDRHRMNFKEGNCRFGKMKFEIMPHVLRVYQPDECGEWPVIDFSKGFPVPWLLQFTDISVPSQHTQDGQRYHAEVVLSHVYSMDNGAKMIGNVAIFLQKDGSAETYDFLELYIRRWQREERRVLRNCSRRNLESYNEEEEFEDEDSLEEGRRLGQMLRREYFNREWHPYDWVTKAGTEYYFRYNGSLPEPPCLEGAHWRVLKDPIKVPRAQIHELERLLAERIDPNTCEKYTAGKPRNRRTWKVSVNRPMQTTTPKHRVVYCECVDWNSRAPNDEAYCAKSMEERGVYNLTENIEGIEDYNHTEDMDEPPPIFLP